MRAAVMIAGAALLLGGMTGCGSDSEGSDGGAADGLPTDASEEAFCANFEKLSSDLYDIASSGDTSGAATVLKDAAGEIEQTGTPSDISEDARAGLQKTLDSIKALPDDATEEEIGNIGEGLSDADEDNRTAFDDYLETTCNIS